MTRKRFLLGLLYFISFVFVLWGIGRLSDARFHSIPFSGRIEKIELSDKGIVMIFVHGRDFYLNNYDRSIEDYLEVGDSVNKPENSWDISVFKMKNDSVVSVSLWSSK